MAIAAASISTATIAAARLPRRENNVGGSAAGIGTSIAPARRGAARAPPPPPPPAPAPTRAAGGGVAAEHPPPAARPRPRPPIWKARALKSPGRRPREEV